SRRRHTRFSRDWSSDVCSSDLYFLKKNYAIKGRRVLAAVFFDRLSGLWALSIITGCLIMFMPRLAIPHVVTISVLVIGTATYLRSEERRVGKECRSRRWQN